MKRVITLVSAAVGLLVWVALAHAQSGQPSTAGQAAGTSNQPVLYSPPTPAVGDTFIYRIGLVRPPQTWTYVGPKGDSLCYSTNQAGSATTTLCGTAPGDFIAAGTSTDTTTKTRLSFPLFVGKIWEYEFTFQPGVDTSFHHFASRYTTTARVTAYEPVTVGAGTFDAFKIEATSLQWGEMGNPFLTTLYYSPQLGVIKRHAFTTREFANPYDINVELISYTRAQAGAAP
jgi:hypothetical protein